jgi:hypothetical protein
MASSHPSGTTPWKHGNIVSNQSSVESLGTQKSIEARGFYWLMRFFAKPTVAPSMAARSRPAWNRAGQSGQKKPEAGMTPQFFGGLRET